MRLQVTGSRASLTRVVASALLKVSRSSRPISVEAVSASRASLGEMRISARRRSPMNSRMRWSIRPRSSGEVDPGGLEDVLAAVAGDRIQAAVLQPDEAVERALRDQVGHRELPAERTRGGVLVPLLRA